VNGSVSSGITQVAGVAGFGLLNPLIEDRAKVHWNRVPMHLFFEPVHIHRQLSDLINKRLLLGSMFFLQVVRTQLTLLVKPSEKSFYLLHHLGVLSKEEVAKLTKN
jgi:hypothetical protein